MVDNNGLFHFPDGSTSDIPPEDGYVCRVPSHKRGKYVDWMWDEEQQAWTYLSKNRTSAAVIDNTKKIMKIGPYFKDRPARKYSSSAYNYWDDIFPYGREPYDAMTGAATRQEWDDLLNGGHVTPRNQIDPVTLYQQSARVREVRGSNPGLLTDITSRHPSEAEIIDMASEGGTWYIPCECGVEYCRVDKEHYRFCPKHPENIKNYIKR